MDERNVVEYKTNGDPFVQRFVYTGYEPQDLYHFFYNDETGEELFIYHKYLETLSTRPLRHNE